MHFSYKNNRATESQSFSKHSVHFGNLTKTPMVAPTVQYSTVPCSPAICLETHHAMQNCKHFRLQDLITFLPVEGFNQSISYCIPKGRGIWCTGCLIEDRQRKLYIYIYISVSGFCKGFGFDGVERKGNAACHSPDQVLFLTLREMQLE